MMGMEIGDEIKIKVVLRREDCCRYTVRVEKDDEEIARVTATDEVWNRAFEVVERIVYRCAGIR